jgi:hypothetical protein
MTGNQAAPGNEDEDEALEIWLDQPGDEELHAGIERLAAARGVTGDDIVHDALREYFDRHLPAPGTGTAAP